MDRSLLLKHCKPNRKESIPFSVPYNSDNKQTLAHTKH